jgi:hypothetical protein
MAIRCCPICKNHNVRRSMRHGVLEILLLRLFLLRPFRCDNCNHRYYGWFFSRMLGSRRVTRTRVSQDT